MVQEFFLDRVIERWRHEIDIDVASNSYLKYPYPLKGYAKECASFKKKNLYILFNQIEWNNEDGEVRMCIYVLDGDFLMLDLRKELYRLSKDSICSTYAINVNNPIIGLSDQCQFRKVSMFKVDENHDIINSMYDFDTKFKYESMVRGMVVNGVLLSSIS